MHLQSNLKVLYSHMYYGAISLHIIDPVDVKPEIPEKLFVLNQEYSDMLVVLQTARLPEEKLNRLKLFLSGFCDELSLKDCLSTEEIVEQLKTKLKIHIFSIDTLTACSKYFENDGVTQSIQRYKEHLDTFLSTTSVKELRSTLKTDAITCLNDAEPRLTLSWMKQLVMTH